MDNFYHHLRFDVRKVQEYIFQVPKLKFMLGANSRIGELFSTTLPELLAGSKSVFTDTQLSGYSEMDWVENFKHNVISSSGGHFEAIFASKEELDEFIIRSKETIASDLPDLEYSISWRKFRAADTFEAFMGKDKPQIQPVCSSGSEVLWYDLPYFELCKQDGVSIAIDYDDDRKEIGNKANIMIEQANYFYNLKTNDAIAMLYKDLKITGKQLVTNLQELVKCGNSKKTNMLAYIKIDGNGTGARFRVARDQLIGENALDAFIMIEDFWAKNRNKISSSLKTALTSNKVIQHIGTKIPYLLLMLGGDDLFLVCIPELALHITTILAKEMGADCPISAGIAFVKSTYPISLANQLAESCLESAKAASYKEEGQPAYIDWHVHFDSVYQDISEIRQSAYMLEYSENDKQITEILSLRPYSLSKTSELVQEVEAMAELLDDPKEEAANNKIKGYRSIVKGGSAETEYFTKMLLSEKPELTNFVGKYQIISDVAGHEIRLNSALDKIELLEFYRDNKGER